LRIVDGKGTQVHHKDVNEFVWLQNMGVGLFCWIAGALFIIPGFLAIRGTYLRMRTWAAVSGTVIGYKEVQQGPRYDPQGKMDKRFRSRTGIGTPNWRMAYDPLVQFAPADGEMITFTSPGSNRKSFRIAAVVRVLYDPKAPENATIRSFSALLLMPIVAIVAGVTLFRIALRWIFFNGHR
jgi:hypothetical protein